MSTMILRVTWVTACGLCDHLVTILTQNKKKSWRGTYRKKMMSLTSCFVRKSPFRLLIMQQLLQIQIILNLRPLGPLSWSQHYKRLMVRHLDQPQLHVTLPLIVKVAKMVVIFLILRLIVEPLLKDLMRALILCHLWVTYLWHRSRKEWN